MRMLPASVTRSLLAGLLLMAGGCAFLKPAPTPILPVIHQSRGDQP